MSDSKNNGETSSKESGNSDSKVPTYDELKTTERKAFRWTLMALSLGSGITSGVIFIDLLPKLYVNDFSLFLLALAITLLAGILFGIVLRLAFNVENIDLFSITNIIPDNKLKRKNASRRRSFLNRLRSLTECYPLNRHGFHTFQREVVKELENYWYDMIEIEDIKAMHKIKGTGDNVSHDNFSIEEFICTQWSIYTSSTGYSVDEIKKAKKNLDSLSKIAAPISLKHEINCALYKTIVYGLLIFGCLFSLAVVDKVYTLREETVYAEIDSENWTRIFGQDFSSELCPAASDQSAPSMIVAIQKSHSITGSYDVSVVAPAQCEHISVVTASLPERLSVVPAPKHSW